MDKLEYIKIYDGAPCDLYEFAEGAVNVQDCDELKVKAVEYLSAKLRFEKFLEDIGVGIG